MANPFDDANAFGVAEDFSRLSGCGPRTPIGAEKRLPQP
jgi:hypothetical protein